MLYTKCCFYLSVTYPHLLSDFAPQLAWNGADVIAPWHIREDVQKAQVACPESAHECGPAIVTRVTGLGLAPS